MMRFLLIDNEIVCLLIFLIFGDKKYLIQNVNIVDKFIIFWKRYLEIY